MTPDRPDRIRLDEITLENIGCFVRKTIRFSELTVIFGENRTGKSTLVYAVYFALYGAHLNHRLKVADLCRKGEAAGTVTLRFEKGGIAYKLQRTTDALPKLYRRPAPEAAWETVPVHAPEVLDAVIGVRPETASVSSFFRESELIYFLQDMPKYNQTLLQSFIGMDDGLVLRTRFKKALGRAREVKKAIENAAPRKSVDPLHLELTRRQLAESEKALTELEQIRRTDRGAGVPDPAIYQLLVRRHQTESKTLETLKSLAEKLPSAKALATEKRDLESRLQEAETALADAEALQRRIGGLIQKTDNLKLRLKHLATLEARAACPICDQAVSPDQAASLVRKIECQLSRAEDEKSRIEARLKNMERLARDSTRHRERLLEIDGKIQKINDIQQRIDEVTGQVTALARDLDRLERPEDGIREAPAPYDPETAVDSRRLQLQEQIIRHRVTLTRYADDLKRADEHRVHIARADRQVLLCTVAARAVEEALQSLGSRLLEKIRKSVGDWSRHFSFLDRFDIEISDRELLPLIQARGYRYKLNQMSKSERIFLYLMLKLAIGDALGHLGFFMLDDPADGLDLKRKQTLAYLLTEAASRRQVLVTTNDADFGDFFAGGVRTEL
ncbi:AAA family ATPase [Desulfococcus sp.]|uniref:AAA family ATPase n=1 Tax=Desulfococcus sp. TaxID=2025834 RepID=UPI003D0E24B6